MNVKLGKFLLASFFLVSLLAIPLLIAAPVMAATYNYNGNQYNYFSSTPPNAALGTHLTASFTFDSSVVTDNYTGYEYFHVTNNSINDIISWSVTSGSITLSSKAQDPEAAGMFHFADGKIDRWYFAVGVNPGYYHMSYNAPGSGASVFDMGNDYYVTDPNIRAYNGVFNNPGTWTKEGSSNAVPIPAAIWLLGSGLVGLLGFRKKFRKHCN